MRQGIAVSAWSFFAARRFSAWLCWTFAAALAGVTAPAHGQQGAWRPDRTVEIVATAAAGGTGDANARFLQKIMQGHRLVDVPVVVVN